MAKGDGNGHCVHLFALLVARIFRSLLLCLWHIQAWTTPCATNTEDPRDSECQRRGGGRICGSGLTLFCLRLVDTLHRVPCYPDADCLMDSFSLDLSLETLRTLCSASQVIPTPSHW